MDATEAGNSAAIKVTALVIEPGSKAFDDFVRHIKAHMPALPRDDAGRRLSDSLRELGELRDRIEQEIEDREIAASWRDTQAWQDAQPHA